MLYLIFASVLISYTSFSNKEKMNSYINEKNNELELSYDIVFNTYQDISKILFDYVIMRSDIMSIFNRTYNASPSELNIIRADLLETLMPSYNKFKKLNIRQLHFHLPNNISFLRLHKPAKFGDDLSSFRRSVYLANKTLLPIIGFEEGRTVNAFRHVYPIIYMGRHLGSVEIDVGFPAFKKKLENMFHNKYSFIIRRDIVEHQVSSDSLDNYIPSDISDDFLYERNIQLTEPVKRLNKKINTMTLESLTTNTIINQVISIDDKVYLVSFIPIPNIDNNIVAFIISYEEDRYLGRILRYSVFEKIIIHTILIVVLFLIIKLAKAYYIIKRQAVEDGLTHIPNRRSFADRIILEIGRSNRENMPLSVIMCDVDNFKLYNDTYGHKAGDLCLETIAGVISDSLHRTTDFCARYGGEEFVVILPSTPLADAYNIALRICKSVESLGVIHKLSLPAEVVTLSLGVSTANSDIELDRDELVDFADKGLYLAKERGRNQVAIYNVTVEDSNN